MESFYHSVAAGGRADTFSGRDDGFETMRRFAPHLRRKKPSPR